MKIVTQYVPNKPLLMGFAISLIGSLPFGYINLIGLKLLIEQGQWAIILFVLGVIVIEFIVLKVVSTLAKWMLKHKKLLLFIDIFTVVFLLSIGSYFLLKLGQAKNISPLTDPLTTHPFFLGVLLSSLNFIQWPYWSGIYILLFQTKKLKSQAHQQNTFISGALIGTFIGMLVFAFSGQYILIKNHFDVSHVLNIVFTVVFFVLGVIQIIKVFFKHKLLSFKKF